MDMRTMVSHTIRLNGEHALHKLELIYCENSYSYTCTVIIMIINEHHVHVIVAHARY